MAAVELISVDDHIIEPPHLWISRAPNAWKERVPRVVEQDGRDVWLYDGNPYFNIGLNAVAGKPPEEWDKEPLRFDDMRPGCYDIAARVADMDLDGVTAQLCFPSYGGFVGRTFLDASDKELALWCIQAYNDFIIDEWCAYAPDRQIPLAIVPMWDPVLAAEEAKRTIERGARAISFSENPHHLGLPTWHQGHWDPLFAVAEEAEIPLCLHIGSSSHVPKPTPDSSSAAWSVMMPMNSMSAASDLVFSPVLHQFPRIKFVLSEGGVGWIPFFLERCDWVFDRHRHWAKVSDAAKPSELFARNIWTCFVYDELGVAERDIIGADKMMWECDYPHSDSIWPESSARIEHLLRDVPDDEATKIRSGNARELFKFPA